MARRATIARMEIITLIISSVALLVSAATLYTVRRMSDAPSSPTVGTKGMGGGGR